MNTSMLYNSINNNDIIIGINVLLERYSFNVDKLISCNICVLLDILIIMIKIYVWSLLWLYLKIDYYMIKINRLYDYILRYYLR